jgi:hypothetical protein
MPDFKQVLRLDEHFHFFLDKQYPGNKCPTADAVAKRLPKLQAVQQQYRQRVQTAILEGLLGDK